MVLRNRVLLYGLFALAALAFGYGACHLLFISMGLGDDYAEYSSYRSDPMGTRALYESLQAVPGFSVERNTQPIKTLRITEPVTVCALGVDPWQLMVVSREGFGSIQGILASGGRFVVAYSSEMDDAYLTGADSIEEEQKKAEDRVRGDKDDKNEKTSKKDTPPSSDEPASKPDGPGKPSSKDSGEKEARDKRAMFGLKMVALHKEWGFKLATAKLPVVDNEVTPSKAVRVAGASLPETITWRSPLVFRELDARWRVLYRRDNEAVIIERSFGAGSVVLCADAYFVSNQAMREERHTRLLSWLIGANTRILFEETQHGVVDEPGVAKLARKYRLQGVAAALLVVVALYIWKSATRLVPPPPEPEATETARAALGKDAASAFIHLLRRSVPAPDLLTVCVREWERAFAHSRPDLRKRVAWMREVAEQQRALPAKRRDLLGTYQTISHELGKEWKR